MYPNAVPIVPLEPAQVYATPIASSSNNSSSRLPQYRSNPLDDIRLQRLIEQGFSRGLAQSMSELKDAFALRIWIVDNSGSMQKTDGHRILPTTKRGEVKLASCSRWEEIRETVEYHVRMAGLIRAPTRFRLLNSAGPNMQYFSVADNDVDTNNNDDETARDVHDALRILRKVRPGGCTPLTAHILDIHSEVSQIAPQLRREGRKVAIVIATDGLPSDDRGYSGPEHSREFVDALRLLEGLPVWVVVRLCTDEEDVVDFYNNLDNEVELSMEVLDDYTGEASEVHSVNPWMNYSLPLHRLREWGCPALDMIDERGLTKTELRDYCCMLFGEEKFDGVADPSIDWGGFVKDVERLMHYEEKQWDPIKKKMLPWLDISKLNKIHGEGGSCTIM